MSFYAEYLKEKTNDQILETDIGFATYRFVDEKTVYIVDIYVAPDFRRSGKASIMADGVVDIAKKRGCTTLIGSVVPSNKGSTDSVKVLFGYGMKLKSSGVDFILFEKEI